MSQTWIEKTRQRHVLRQIIKGEELLQDIVDISNRLMHEAVDMKQNQVMALKGAADLKLKMLDKVLPDLKSVEHEMTEGLAGMTEDELRERIRNLAAAIDPRLFSGVGPADAGEAATVN